MTFKYVPKGYSETDDFFAGVMVDAPDFAMDGMSIDDAFERLVAGIDSVIAKAKQERAIAMLNVCKVELSAIRKTFLDNVGKNAEEVQAGRERLQHAYYELYRKAGQLLKPGAVIGPDDEV